VSAHAPGLSPGVEPGAAAVAPGRPPRLLCVFAHPDDETLACGGTIALCARRGVEVTIYSATAGHAGGPGPRSRAAERARLAAVRSGELHEAAARLGATRVEIGPFRDGFLPHTTQVLIDEHLTRLIEAVGPDAVITFDRDGLYWHPDHVAIGQRTAVVTRRVAPGAALYFALLPREAISGLVRAVRARAPEADATLWGIPPRAFGLHAAEPTDVLDVRAAAEPKLDALRCHRTQLSATHPFTWLDARLVREWLGEEWFRRDETSAGSPDLLRRLVGQPEARPASG
jgi:LmbE family N-acetylglucosaminyl deacetylase